MEKIDEILKCSIGNRQRQHRYILYSASRVIKLDTFETIAFLFFNPYAIIVCMQQLNKLTTIIRLASGRAHDLLVLWSECE